MERNFLKDISSMKLFSEKARQSELSAQQRVTLNDNIVDRNNKQWQQNVFLTAGRDATLVSGPVMSEPNPDFPFVCMGNIHRRDNLKVGYTNLANTFVVTCSAEWTLSKDDFNFAYITQSSDNEQM